MLRSDAQGGPVDVVVKGAEGNEGFGEVHGCRPGDQKTRQPGTLETQRRR